EWVVMVEHGCAAGQRELGQSCAGGRVLGLLVDCRPDRVERLQPAEQVLVLRAGARQVLPEVVVRVDETGSDDGAGEVDDGVRIRTAAGSDGRDEAVVDVDPAAGVLRAVVVHGHDVRVDEEGAHTSSGTISKRSTSTRPRSVIVRLVITARPK